MKVIGFLICGFLYFFSTTVNAKIFCNELISGNVTDEAGYTVISANLSLTKQVDSNDDPFYELEGKLGFLWQGKEILSDFFMTAYLAERSGLPGEGYVEDDDSLTIENYPTTAVFNKQTHELTIRRQVSTRNDLHVKIGCSDY